jgi:hypothetical protein
MKNKILVDVIRFALSQKSLSKKIIYFFKGLVFVFFLTTINQKTAKGETTAATSQAGDDIYPLF